MDDKERYELQEAVALAIAETEGHHLMVEIWEPIPGFPSQGENETRLAYMKWADAALRALEAKGRI